MSINWVMIPTDASKPFIPLPRERLLLSSPARTSFSLKTPKPSSSAGGAAPNDPTATVDISSAGGIAYLTTSRLIYLPQPSTSTFQSFSVPLLNYHDSHVTAPFFGPNVLVGSVKPSSEGGLPVPNHPPYLIELKLTFKDGGAYDFHTKLCEVRERLIQAREIVREIGENNVQQEIHGEQLPAYEAGGSGASTNPSIPSAPAHRADRDSAADRPPPFTETAASPSMRGRDLKSKSGPSGSQAPPPPPPDDPPPGYDDATS